MNATKSNVNNLYGIDELGSEDAERYVAGGCLLDRKTYESLRAIISAEDFKFIKYQYILEAMQALETDNQDITTASVVAKLKAGDNDRYTLIGGISTLLSLEKTARDETNIVKLIQYAELIKRLSIRRKALVALDKARLLVLRRDLNVPVIGVETDNLIKTAFHRTDSTPPPSLMRGASQYYDYADSAENGDIPSRLYTGFSELDNPSLLGGFGRNNLVIVGGESSMGKTAFAVSMANNMAKDGKKGLFISMEMSINEMAQRFIAAETGISLMKLRPWAKDDLKRMTTSWRQSIEKTPRERQQIIDYLNNPALDNISLIHKPTLTALEVWSEARRFKLQHGRIDFVIVDLITNLTADEKDEARGNRAQELTQIAGTLKEMASPQHLDSTVIVLSQVSGAVQSRSDKRPLEGDFRDSKGIGFQADVQMFVYRDSRYNEQANPLEAEIIIRKHRGGAIGKRVLRWHPTAARFLSETPPIPINPSP